MADELPDWFIQKIRTAMDETKPGSFLLGEVWEDASTKVAYSQRRKYLLGGELHGVMNYPFRTALLTYLRGGPAQDFQEAMETLRENYPAPAYCSLMNFLGTHDTARILTVLGAERVPETKEERAVYRLSPDERRQGETLVRLAALVLFTFPGSPTVYYGDELGMEGWEDPFNRGTYPWGAVKSGLLPLFRQLGKLRGQSPALQSGAIRYLKAEGPLLAYVRETEFEKVAVAVNAGPVPVSLTTSWDRATVRDLLTNRRFHTREGILTLSLPPWDGLLLR